MSEERLPVHGFVLAGGKSSRMGQDKAQMQFCGRLLVEIAVARLQAFCSSVSIVGNRDDLNSYAPIVHETRLNTGPGAGLEAGLLASQQLWSLFTPVDVPLLPARVLRQWTREVIAGNHGASFLSAGEDDQPAFCLVRKERLPFVSAALERGERRISNLLHVANEHQDSTVCRANVERFAGDISPSAVSCWFSNVNTPSDLAETEARARSGDWKPADLAGMPYCK